MLLSKLVNGKGCESKKGKYLSQEILTINISYQFCSIHNTMHLYVLYYFCFSPAVNLSLDRMTDKPFDVWWTGSRLIPTERASYRISLSKGGQQKYLTKWLKIVTTTENGGGIWHSTPITGAAELKFRCEASLWATSSSTPSNPNILLVCHVWGMARTSRPFELIKMVRIDFGLSRSLGNSKHLVSGDRRVLSIRFITHRREKQCDVVHCAKYERDKMWWELSSEFGDIVVTRLINDIHR